MGCHGIWDLEEVQVPTGGVVDALPGPGDGDAAPIRCPSAFDVNGYLHVTMQLSWQEAEAHCVGLGVGSPAGTFTHLAVMSTP